MASNHASFFDPIIVSIGAPRKLVFLARDTLFCNKVFARLLNWLHAYPLKRDGGIDLRAFKLAINKLSDGKAVLVFPEGTRSGDGSLQEPRLGIGFLEAVTQAYILPCYVKGSLEAWPRNSRFPRLRPVSVYFGRPFNSCERISEDKKKWYRHIAGQTMTAISELKRDAETRISTDKT